MGSTAQELTITLTGSMYNGSGVPCFGLKEGNIQCVASGGVGPYVYQWSNGNEGPVLLGVPAGYYNVKVSDSQGVPGYAEFTLTEPESMKVEGAVFEYPNGKNISCYNCYNGSINLTVTRGTPPYSYTWDDQVITEDRSGLGATRYAVLVRDVNGCEEKYEAKLEGPERSDWTMSGNANTDPTTQYIGTSDNKDVVFKSNGAERLRLKGNGDIALFGSIQSAGLLARGADGNLFVVRDLPPAPPGTPCADDVEAQPFWKTKGNNFDLLCPGVEPKLGTLNNMRLRIITNNQERMIVSNTGKVSMQSDLALGVSLIADENWTNARLRVKANSGRWLSLEGADNSTWSLSRASDALEFQFMQNQWDSQDNPKIKFWNNGKVSIGQDVNVATDVDYGLYVWRGILTERVKVAVKTSLDWSDHVFAPDYQLPTLDEVQAFIVENGHLPGVPSADCMVEEGLDVAKTDAMLLQKIEELTLYLIAMEQRLRIMEQVNMELKDQIVR